MPTQVITGLEHLEGMEVTIFADAGYMLPRTVVNGSITLDYPVTKAIIGLAYTAVMETLNLEYTYGGGSIGKPKNIFKAYVDLQDTVGLEVGCRTDLTDNVPFRTLDSQLDSPIPPYTGTKEVIFNKGYDKEVSLVVRHPYPMPCTVRSISMTVKVNKQ
jgi:hypothetical protein